MIRRIAATVLCLVLLFDVEVACSPLRTLAPAATTTLVSLPGRGR